MRGKPATKALRGYLLGIIFRMEPRDDIDFAIAQGRQRLGRILYPLEDDAFRFGPTPPIRFVALQYQRLAVASNKLKGSHADDALLPPRPRPQRRIARRG